MKGGGYFIARAIWDHSSFAGEPYSEREAFMWLIGAAAWEPRTVRVGGRNITLQRGQLVHSLRFLAAKFGWPEPRVRRFLQRRINDAQIDAVSTHGTTQITICNYDEYQHGQRTPYSEIDAGMVPKSTQRRTINNKTNNNPSPYGEGSAREEAKVENAKNLFGELAEPVGGKTEKPKRSAPTLCPEDFEPTPEHYQLADELGMTSREVTAAACEMRDWSRGGGKKKLDWNATFRNWLRSNARRRGGGGRGGPGRGPSGSGKTFAEMARGDFG